MNLVLIMSQIRTAIQFMAQADLLTEEQKLTIADIYKKWEDYKGHYVPANEILSYGVNEFGETQLYQVNPNMGHNWQADYTPDKAVSLYKKIGFTPSGTPIWVQPIAYDDAWDIGDKVSHNGKIWRCNEGNANGANGMRNTFEPGVWGWVEDVA